MRMQNALLLAWWQMRSSMFETTSLHSRNSPVGPQEMCLSLEHENPSKTSEKMGYFDGVTI